MSTDGSAAPRTTLPALLAPPAVWVGWIAMVFTGGTFAQLGLRPAFIASEIALVTPALLALVSFGIPLRLGLALEPLATRTALLALLAGAALWAFSYGLFEVQYAIWLPPAGYLEAFRKLHEALKPSGPFDALVSVTAIALVPALCEELLFRGIVLPAFVRRIRPWIAVLLSAVLFGSIHVDVTPSQQLTLYRVPFATAVGLALGILRLRAGSLMPCILAHAFLNTTTFLLVLAEGPTDAPEEANLLRGVGALLLSTAVAAWLLRRFPRQGQA
jgi:membrane protease YdiL (CAAX protease family)